MTDSHVLSHDHKQGVELEVLVTDSTAIDNDSLEVIETEMGDEVIVPILPLM